MIIRVAGHDVENHAAEELLRRIRPHAELADHEERLLNEKLRQIVVITDGILTREQMDARTLLENISASIQKKVVMEFRAKIDESIIPEEKSDLGAERLKVWKAQVLEEVSEAALSAKAAFNPTKEFHTARHRIKFELGMLNFEFILPSSFSFFFPSWRSRRA
jgi:hypothetical protein